MDAVCDALEDVDIRIVVALETLLNGHSGNCYTTSAPTRELGFTSRNRLRNRERLRSLIPTRAQAVCGAATGICPATWRVATLNRFQALIVTMPMSSADSPASS